MRANAAILACTDVGRCDSCVVKHTCRRVKAEYAVRRRQVPSNLLSSVAIALDKAISDNVVGNRQV